MTTRKKPPTLNVTPSISKTEPDGHISINQNQDRVQLSLRSGASTTILLHGATVISWTISSKELLFLSTASALDGSTPVRGGIPLVFPVFGPPPAGTAVEKLPQHGFARNSKWELLGRTEESDDVISVDLGLGPEGLDEETKEKWGYQFGLIYTITLTKDALETKILVQNTEEEKSFDFNLLFHNYLRVPDISTISISGLTNLTYRDKIANGAESTEQNEELKITSAVDRVYKSVPGDVIVKSDGAPLFTVTKDGLDDTVVWNPWETGTASIKDFEPKDGYKQMICVEAGSVATWQSLEAGATFEGGVRVQAHL